MDRRELLRYTAWLTGATVSAPLVSVLLSGCSRSTDGTPDTFSLLDDTVSPDFFSASQFALVALLADTILPRTDSPSATDVEVHRVVDAMFAQVYAPDFVAEFQANWSELYRYLEQNNFVALAPNRQQALLQGLDTSDDDNLRQARRAYLELKQQVIGFYLTSEVIAKQYLRYLPIPGFYQGCMPLDDSTNAWAI